MGLGLAANVQLRPATPADFPAFRRICLQTGDAGKDATALHDDPDLIGDFFAVPYAVLEPEHAFAVEDLSGVVGYVLGALDSRAFYDRLEMEWLAPLRRRISDPGGEETAWRGSDWVRRLVHQPYLAVPPVLASYPSHGHIDLLPQAQGKGIGRRGFIHLMRLLGSAGSPGMHVQVHPKNLRAQRFYTALEFNRLDSPDLPADTWFMGHRLG